MSSSQAPPGSNEDERMKVAMGDEVVVEDHDNKSTYNSLSSSESLDSEIVATASEEVKKLARRIAKKMAKMMKKMEKQETSSSSQKKTAPPRK